MIYMLANFYALLSHGSPQFNSIQIIFIQLRLMIQDHFATLRTCQNTRLLFFQQKILSHQFLVSSLAAAGRREKKRAAKIFFFRGFPSSLPLRER
jgi:hypothetical protein